MAKKKRFVAVAADWASRPWHGSPADALAHGVRHIAGSPKRRGKRTKLIILEVVEEHDLSVSNG